MYAAECASGLAFNCHKLLWAKATGHSLRLRWALFFRACGILGRHSDWNTTQFWKTNERSGTTAMPSTSIRKIAYWLWKALQSRYLQGSIWETECGFGVLRVLLVLLVLTLWHGCRGKHTATWFISFSLSSIIQGFWRLRRLGRSPDVSIWIRAHGSPGFRRDPWFETPNLDARYLWLPCTKYDELIKNDPQVWVIHI